MNWNRLQKRQAKCNIISPYITNNGQTMRSLVLEAEKHLQACDRKLEDCAMILDSLEGLLETTPKPSELLGL